MQSSSTAVEQYLAALPPDRRAVIEAVRAVILKNLDADYEEGIQYRMIGYYVPHRVHPAGYHCDPRQPLPFAALAAQKNYFALHLMPLYVCGPDDPGAQGKFLQWFKESWAKSGKKLDMGKACIRFKKIDDVPLDLIGEAIKKVPAAKWISTCRPPAKSDRRRRPSASA